MAGPLTDRFESMEERLQSLDKVGLSRSLSGTTAPPTEASTADSEGAATAPWDYSRSSGSEGLEAHDQSDPTASTLTPSEVSNGSSAIYLGTPSQPTPEYGCDGSFPRPARMVPRDRRPAAAIQEFQEELMTIVEEAVNGADRRLRRLVEQAAIRFSEDLEKSLQKSASLIADRVIQTLQQEIQIATQLSLSADLVSVKTSLCGSTPETNCPHHEGKMASGHYFRRAFEQAERELPVVAGTVRRDSAALRSNLDGRLRATLHAFEEDAAKQLVGSSQKTDRKLVERELEGSHAPAAVGESASKSLQTGGGIFGRVKLRKAKNASIRKKNQPNWRILGLT